MPAGCLCWMPAAAKAPGKVCWARANGLPDYGWGDDDVDYPRLQPADPAKRPTTQVDDPAAGNQVFRGASVRDNDPDVPVTRLDVEDGPEIKEP